MRKSVSVTNNKRVKDVTERRQFSVVFDLGHIDGDCREIASNFSPTQASIFCVHLALK